MSMTGTEFYNYILRTFKRTDKETETYEAVTDAISHLKTIEPFNTAETTTATASDLATASGTYRISLPSDFSQLTADPIFIESTTSDSGVTMKKGGIADINWIEGQPERADVPTGTPYYYAIYGGYIYINPVSDGVYKIRLYYASNQATSITSATSAVPFSDNSQRMMLLYWTLFFLYSGMQGDQEAAKYKALAESETERLQIFDARKREAETVIEYHGV